MIVFLNTCRRCCVINFAIFIDSPPHWYSSIYTKLDCNKCIFRGQWDNLNKKIWLRQSNLLASKIYFTPSLQPTIILYLLFILIWLIALGGIKSILLINKLLCLPGNENVLFYKICSFPVILRSATTRSIQINPVLDIFFKMEMYGAPRSRESNTENC